MACQPETSGQLVHVQDFLLRMGVRKKLHRANLHSDHSERVHKKGRERISLVLAWICKMNSSKMAMLEDGQVCDLAHAS